MSFSACSLSSSPNSLNNSSNTIAITTTDNNTNQNQLKVKGTLSKIINEIFKSIKKYFYFIFYVCLTSGVLDDFYFVLGAFY